MDLVQIRYFLALAECLNFTRAAEACNVSQPALTKSIQRLENELGGPLILRERSLTQLTELGRCVLPTLQQTLQAAETARTLAASLRNPAKTALRLGIGPNVETLPLLPLIRELGRTLSGFELTIRQGTTAEVNDWLERSDVDVGVIADADALTERAHRWILFADKVMALIPQGHGLDGEGPVQIAALGPHLCVGETSGETPLDRVRARIVAQCGGGAGPAHAGSCSKHIDEIVLTGLGLALCTQRHQPPDGLLRRPLSPPSSLDVCIAVVAGRPPGRAADLFLKLARARDWGQALPS